MMDTTSMMVATSLSRTVDKCSSVDRSGDTVVADLEGALLCGRSSFPYFAHMAFDAGGVLRFLLFLVLAPVAQLLYYLVSESAGMRLLIFTSVAGLKMSEVEGVARAVLPKLYCSDLHPESWRVFSACGRRIVLTASPRIMAEAFLKEYAGADVVLGTELVVWGGRATGIVSSPGVLLGEKKSDALRKALGETTPPELGIGDRHTNYQFRRLCKEWYVVPRTPNIRPVPPEKLAKPVIFHDGRLVQKLSPALALLTVLWLPIGFLLSCIRVAAGSLLPLRMACHGLSALGVRLTVKGNPPPPAGREKTGVLFVCSHRTLLDAVFVSAALGRPVTSVSYSVSRLSELLSPIRLVGLTRDRAADASMIRRLLQEGDLVICPEGTTCREPFLLRFSALFAELTDEIVPVAMEIKGMSMFHATTARGWKGLDPFYFMMNPSPEYVVTFLNKLPHELTCKGGGKTSHEVANYVQTLIASTLSYQCTNFTRKDKYRLLAGNDGSVSAASKANIQKK